MSEDKKRRRRRDVTNMILIVACLVGLTAAGAAVLTGIFAPGAANGPGQQAEAAQKRPDWVDAILGGVRGQGFDWLSLDYADRVATVTGEAAGDDIARRGFAAAETAIRRDRAASADVDVVINNISVAGAAGIGAAFAQLGRNPSVTACQDAFTATLAGRFVRFERASARINPDSAQLLDALSGVAIRCQAYQIEIGGHTDASGGAGRNLILSQDRASAVKTYFVTRNVPAGQLSAIGYGEDRPLDEGTGPDADARNRRIAFTVR